MLFVRDKSFYKTFFSLTVLIALQNVIVFSVNLADNVMLGAYNEISLSGVALVNQIQYLLQMLIMGVGEGLIVLTAQYWGRRELEPIRRLVGIGLRIGAAVALSLWAVVFFFPHGCLSLLTNDEAVIAEGVKYLRIICFSYLFFAITNILLAALRSVEIVKIAFAVSFSTLCINVCLNSLLIYGNWGAPRLGVEGAAIATLAARVVEFLIISVYVLKKDTRIRLRLKDLVHFDRPLAHDFQKSGVPVILSNGMWGVAMAVQTSILGHLGAQAIAANSIATTVFQILSVVCYGAASASAVVVGKTIGQGRIDQVRRYAKTLQILYLLIGVATGLALFFSRDLILQFYAISPQTKQLASWMMAVLSVAVCGTSYQVACLTGIVRGGGDTRFVLYNDTIFMWGLVIPLSVLGAFVFGWPPVAVFICLKCDQILKCFVAAVKVNRGNWIRALTRQKAESFPQADQ